MVNPKTEKDFENLSDEDFLKLNEEDFSGDLDVGETDFSEAAPKEETNEETSEESNVSVDTDDNSDSGELDDAEFLDLPSTLTEEKEELGDEGKSDNSEEESQVHQQPETDTEEETSAESDEASEDSEQVKETPAKAGYYKIPEGFDTSTLDQAVSFYQKLSVPFKADGKDFTIRSPEDAIRLMQQGVNYSRRMQELKPMKTLNRMLQDNNLTDQNKINFLIDVSKGDKEAITQLLKNHKIDPMDLDIDKDSSYQAKNYAGNTQDNEFRDTLDEVITTPVGQALVTHIYNDWDPESKKRLRENPAILGNLTDLKNAGVYDKVLEELNYQKSIGYLTNVPFLQAFDQVGEAMKNAGLFNSPQPAAHGNSMAPIRQTPSQPVASGARKAPAPKKAAPNPHLSSTPPSKQSGNIAPRTPDFDKMSDEDFLKMAPPE